jgi:aryl-alcohol dehydrogenase-like predicted oxidoreductase
MLIGGISGNHSHNVAVHDRVAGLLLLLFGQPIELGITFWDTANGYGQGASEETGRAIRKYTRREDIVLATKVFFKVGDGPGGAGLSRRVDASLARLGTDYIDLYQIHRLDPETPVEETMEALHDVVKAGKARYIGASSMSGEVDFPTRKVLRSRDHPVFSKPDYRRTEHLSSCPGYPCHQSHDDAG